MTDSLLNTIGLLAMLAILFLWLHVGRPRAPAVVEEDDSGFGEESYFFAIGDDGAITEGNAEIEI